MQTTASVGMTRAQRRRLKKGKGPVVSTQVPKPAPAKGVGKKKKKKVPNAQRWNVNRVGANLKNQILPLKTASPSINFVATINNNALREFCIGYLSASMCRGGVGRLDPNDYPLAFQFITNSLAASFTGKQYSSGEVPSWFRNICQGFQPKVVKLDGGQGNYTFSYSGTPPGLTSPEVPIGPLAWGYMFNFSLPDNTLSPVNGFPVCSLFTPGTYTDSAGSNSFQKIAQLMMDTATSKNELAVMVPSTSPTKFLKDVSAFSIARPVQGFGSTNSSLAQLGGSFGHLTQSEVPINCPLLACVGSGSADDNRYPRFQVTFGGDPTFLSAMASSVITPPEFCMKRAPRFHCIDFNEDYETIAMWIQGMQQSAATEEAGISYADLQCPLTLQEVGLLLRNIKMQAYKDTQPAVQGLGPVAPNVNGDNYFMPYLCAPGTCPIVTTPMILPVPVIESIRSTVFRKLFPGANQGNAGDAQYFIPILGQFVYDQLSQADYTYTDPTGTSYPSFKSTAAIWRRKRRNSKSKSSGDEDYQVEVMAESPIDFIDGYSGSNAIAINDPGQLTELTMLWNQWMTQNVIQSHSCRTAQWSTDLGISVLTSICMQKHQNTPPVSRQLQIQEHFWEDTRMSAKRQKSVTASPYATRQAVMDSSAVPILSAPYEAILGTWNLPFNYVVEVTSGGATQSTKIQRMQALEGEPFSQALTSGATGILMSEHHNRYAMKMVKSRLAMSTQWDEFFDQMEKLGRGGILSGLVGGLAKAVFPSASGVIDAISGALPI